MENFENENKDKNNTISELENIDQLNYELSKLTPLNELFNNEQEKIELNLINKNIGNIPGFNRNDASIVRPTNEITIPVVQQDNGRIFGSTTEVYSMTYGVAPIFTLVYSSTGTQQGVYESATFCSGNAPVPPPQPPINGNSIYLSFNTKTC